MPTRVAGSVEVGVDFAGAGSTTPDRSKATSSGFLLQDHESAMTAIQHPQANARGMTHAV